MSASPQEDIRQRETWLSDVPLQLLDDVELLIGANDLPMLFHGKSGHYIKLSRSAVQVLNLLDGTRTGNEIAATLASRSATGKEQVSEVVQRFLTDLRKAGVLNIAPASLKGWPKLLQALRNKPMLRLRMTGSLEGLLGPVVAVMKRQPPALVRAMAVMLLMMCPTLIAAVFLVTNSSGLTASWPMVMLFVALHAGVHELAHALVCQWAGYPIREAGVGLLYYFLPVAYIDRTDAYRIRQRSYRAAIALAGPALDLVGAGVSALVVLLGNGQVEATAHAVLIVQLVFLVNNLNPFLPSDGYHALEAAMGQLNLRDRAFSYLAHRLLRLRLPSGLAYITRGQRWLYLAYAVVISVYVAGLAIGVATLVHTYLFAATQGGGTF